MDTSAWLAVLDADEHRHPEALRIWQALLEGGHDLVTSSYVLVETLALVQRRLGLDAFRVFHTDVFPLLDVIWVEQDLHISAATQVLAANERRLSLVDCSSLAILQSGPVRVAFVFDRHFELRGVDCLPSATIPETLPP